MRRLFTVCGRCHNPIPNLIGCVVCGNGVVEPCNCVSLTDEKMLDGRYKVIEKLLDFWERNGGDEL